MNWGGTMGSASSTGRAGMVKVLKHPHQKWSECPLGDWIEIPAPLQCMYAYIDVGCHVLTREHRKT